MSYLVQGLVRAEANAIVSETHLPKRLGDEPRDLSGERRDDECAHFWLDVGGEG